MELAILVELPIVNVVRGGVQCWDIDTLDYARHWPDTLKSFYRHIFLIPVLIVPATALTTQLTTLSSCPLLHKVNFRRRILLRDLLGQIWRVNPRRDAFDPHRLWRIWTLDLVKQLLIRFLLQNIIIRLDDHFLALGDHSLWRWIFLQRYLALNMGNFPRTCHCVLGCWGFYLFAVKHNVLLRLLKYNV